VCCERKGFVQLIAAIAFLIACLGFLLLLSFLSYLVIRHGNRTERSRSLLIFGGVALILLLVMVYALVNALVELRVLLEPLDPQVRGWLSIIDLVLGGGALVSVALGLAVGRWRGPPHLLTVRANEQHKRWQRG
jgi:hypothetical protein